MVEINHQRQKAFLDMLAWSEGTDNGRQKTEIMVMTSLWAGYLLNYSVTSPTFVTLGLKLKSTGAGRYQLLSVGGMPTASSLARKTSLRKSDAGHCSRLRAWRRYPMIDHGDIRQANRPLQQYHGLHCGRWLWSVRA